MLFTNTDNMYTQAWFIKMIKHPWKKEIEMQMFVNEFIE